MDNFIGEIRVFPYSSLGCPKGWLPCAGQILSIAQNRALFALLGKTYGGDGQVTFALPDLRGRAILGVGMASFGIYPQGVPGGEESVTLNATQMPMHNHNLGAMNSNGAFVLNTPTPVETPAIPIINNLPAGTTINAYTGSNPNTPLIPASMGNSGSSVAHENRVPLLALNVCIAVSTGVYPPRS